VLVLARARQQLAYRGMLHPTWEELTEAERAESLPPARAYLQVAIEAGLLPDVTDADPSFVVTEALSRTSLPSITRSPVPVPGPRSTRGAGGPRSPRPSWTGSTPDRP
jgi:hypothetical protein